MNTFCDYFGLWFLTYCTLDSNSEIRSSRAVSKTKFEVEFKWQYVNYTWPNEKIYNYAIDNGLYIPANNALMGLKIYKNKMFLTTPKLKPGVPVTLSYISLSSSNKLNELLHPYPDWVMNTGQRCSSLQSVESVEIDKNGIMWIVDGVRINNATKCPSKLVLLDLNNNGKVLHSYDFPNDITSNQGGFLRDIVIDESDNEFAYITDNNAADPGLIVYSRLRDKSWKFRDRSMFADSNASAFLVNGKNIVDLSDINGLALSPKSTNKERYVYYCSVNSYNLYAISTNILKNEAFATSSQWRSNIVFVGQKQSQSDGITMDSEGNLYYSLLPLYGVAKWNINNTIASAKIIDQNRKILVWPDSFAFDNNGHLYVLANGAVKYGISTKHVQINSEVNFRILIIYTGTKNYMY